MEDIEIRQKAQQILEDFEASQSNPPSEAWQQVLRQRLGGTEPLDSAGFSTKHYTLLVLFFVLLNGAFIGLVFKKNIPHEEESGQTLQYSERQIALETLSKELFSNPTTINN
jgi:hypothetical protein